MSKKVQFHDLFNYTCLEILWLLTTMFSFVSLCFFDKILLLLGKCYFYWENLFTSRPYTFSPTVSLPGKGTAIQRLRKGSKYGGVGYRAMNK